MFKKQDLLLIALLAFTLLISGCGGNDAESAASGSQPSAANEATASTAEETPAAEEKTTRTYTDVMGRTVEIPLRPQRIVAHYFASEIYALGLPLAGTNFINAAAVLTEDQLKGVEDVGGEGTTLNQEKVLSLTPDIIIVPSFMEAADLDNLSKIAPTVAVDFGANVFDRLRTIGDIAGNKDKAEEWIAAYNAKAAEKRNALQTVVQPGETAAAFIVHQDKQFYVYAPGRVGLTMHDALGLAVPPKVKELFDSKPDSLWEALSMEVLPEYAADYMFLLVPGSNEDARKIADEIVGGPIWKNLPAVKNGKAFVVDSKWGFADPATLDWLLDEMTNTMMKK